MVVVWSLVIFFVGLSWCLLYFFMFLDVFWCFLYRQARPRRRPAPAPCKEANRWKDGSWLIENSSGMVNLASGNGESLHIRRGQSWVWYWWIVTHSARSIVSLWEWWNVTYSSWSKTQKKTTKDQTTTIRKDHKRPDDQKTPNCLFWCCLMFVDVCWCFLMIFDDFLWFL